MSLRRAAARYRTLDADADAMLADLDAGGTVAGREMDTDANTMIAEAAPDLSRTHEQILELVDEIIDTALASLTSASAVPPQAGFVLRGLRHSLNGARADFARVDPAPFVTMLHNLGRRCLAIGEPAQTS